MKKIYLLLFITSCLTLHSCSTIDTKIRNDKSDIKLNESNRNQLNGTYKIYDTKNQISLPFIIGKSKFETVQDGSIKLESIDEKKIAVTIMKNDSIIESYILKGKFKNGYFIKKTKFTAEFPFGPLLWGLGNYKNALGINNENNLIILENHSGMSFFLIAPIFGAGGDYEVEYKKL
jgi:hypothetical protein